MVSGKQAESYLEGGVSAEGEVAEADWEPTETCLESGGGSPQLLPAPALTPPGRHHLEDMAGCESGHSDPGLQGLLLQGSLKGPFLLAWGREVGTQCLLGTLSELWTRHGVHTRERH